MHESTLRDIRERSLEISVPYIKQIIEVLIEYGAKPLISTEELAIIMTYGIGNLFCVIRNHGLPERIRKV